MVRLIAGRATGRAAGQVWGQGDRLADDRVRTEVAGSGLVPAALLVLLVGLLFVALAARRRTRRTAALLLLPMSAAWVAFNGPIEGPVLLTISTGHGVTVADLLAVVGILVALTVLAREPRS